jgi:hypothetical protein
MFVCLCARAAGGAAVHISRDSAIVRAMHEHDSQARSVLASSL